MSDEEKKQEGGPSRDFASWFAGRRNEAEKWVEETCNRAISKARGVLKDEIRSLARRVDSMHELLDQIEQLLEAQSCAQEKSADVDKNEEGQ